MLRISKVVITSCESSIARLVKPLNHISNILWTISCFHNVYRFNWLLISIKYIKIAYLNNPASIDSLFFNKETYFRDLVRPIKFISHRSESISRKFDILLINLDHFTIYNHLHSPPSRVSFWTVVGCPEPIPNTCETFLKNISQTMFLVFACTVFAIIIFNGEMDFFMTTNSPWCY